MLQNEGVAFDDHHTRLDYGPDWPKLISLSRMYDLLRERWFQKTLSDVHPALRWHSPSTRTGVPETPATIGWSFTTDDPPEHGLPRKNSHRAKRLTIIAERQPSMRNGLGSTIQEEENTHSSPPQTPAAVVKPSVSESTMTHAAAAAYRPGLPTIAPKFVHGPSPLQHANTASMLLADDEARTQTINGADEMFQRPRPRQHEHAGVLGLLVEDERRRAKEQQRHEDKEKQSTELQVAEKENTASSKDSKKGKSVKKWLRSIFEDSELARSMDRMGPNVGGDF